MTDIAPSARRPTAATRIPGSGFVGGLSPQIRGVLLVVLAAAFFGSMHNTVRYVTDQLHPFEVAFFRNVFGVIFLLPWFLAVGFDGLGTQYMGKHVVRAMLNAFAMLTWFVALSLIPVAEATALALSGPVFVALGAMVILKEPVGPRRWVGMGIAVVGGLIIVRPGFVAVELPTWLVLFSALAVSGSRLIAKSLAKTDNTTSIVGYLSFLQMPLTLVPALFVWQWPSMQQLGWLALIGICGTLGHLLFIRAYKLADVSLVEPFTFTRVIWAALIGLIVFSEFPDLWTWVGAAVIIAGTTWMARREAVVREHTGEALP